MAEAVIAAAPHKVFPGGVIVLRATDWMAGGATDEADARANEGEVVREDQTVATSIFSSPTAAYQAAADTLEIDLSTLPLLLDMTYEIWFSLLIEGDWDVTNSDTFRGANQHQFTSACRVGWHGTANFSTDATPAYADYLPRDRPHFTIVSSASTGDLDLTETLTVRAYAQSGTTIEFLIDQVLLVPFVASGTHAVSWTNVDFEPVGGQWNAASGSLDLTDGSFVDGADGGDANGKFTWSPIPSEETVFMGSEVAGGGDYQKASDNEYMVRVVLDDFKFIESSVSDAEAPCWAYSAHGSNFRPAKTWLDDDFSRTVASGSGNGKWGTGPQGFGWWTTQSNGLMGVNGSQGFMQTNNLIGQSSCQAALSGSAGGAQAAAQINAPNYTISGVLGAAGSAAADFAFVVISLIGRAPSYPDFELVFDLVANTWTIQSGGGNVFEGPHTTPGTTIGWKIEIRRHRLRVKVWSGAEPGTWDYDDFPPNGPDNYPYGDNLEKSTEFVAFYPVLALSTTDANPNITITWDDILIEYDPYGDPGEMTATMEKPNGTQVGTIDIPYGAYQLISWGSKDWTVEDSGDGYLDFSSKVWNEAGTAELQRAEALMYFFRAVHGGIISMNWSQALPVDITRVHG